MLYFLANPAILSLIIEKKNVISRWKFSNASAYR